MAARNLIRIDNTRFIFETNFAGDPERDRYGSEARKGNIIIPDYEQAMDLIDMGFNVKTTKPREGEEENFVPKYYVAVKVNFDTDWPPKICLVSGDAEPVKLDEESISLIHTCYVLNVNVILNPYTDKRTGRKSLYVRTMYVEQDVEEDPYASRYGRN